MESHFSFTHSSLYCKSVYVNPKTLAIKYFNNLLKNRPYLDNFVTNPIHIFTYSGDSDPKSPEYAKKLPHLVTKLSRYGPIYSPNLRSQTSKAKTQPDPMGWQAIQINRTAIETQSYQSSCDKNRPYLDNFLTNPIHILPYSGDSDPKSPEYHKIYMHLLRSYRDIGQIMIPGYQYYWYNYKRPDRDLINIKSLV